MSKIISKKELESKLEKKIRLLIRDFREKNKSDVIIKCKELIDYLITGYLREKDKDFLKKRHDFEEKINLLLTNKIIPQKTFDNCILTKSLRNPTEHQFIEPREEFVNGAIKTLQELYFYLQIILDLPEIKEWNNLARKLKSFWPFFIKIDVNKIISTEECDKIKSILNNYPGYDACMISFPQPNKLDNTPGINLSRQKRNRYLFNEDLRKKLELFSFVSNVNRKYIFEEDFLPGYSTKVNNS